MELVQAPTSKRGDSCGPKHRILGENFFVAQVLKPSNSTWDATLAMPGSVWIWVLTEWWILCVAYVSSRCSLVEREDGRGDGGWVDTPLGCKWLVIMVIVSFCPQDLGLSCSPSKWPRFK